MWSFMFIEKKRKRPQRSLAASGEQMFLENRFVPDGKVSFRDISQEAGVALPAVGFSATAGDVIWRCHRDGWTDIYVTSYNRYGRVMPINLF